MSSHIKNFVESVADLPIESRRKLELIRELDIKYHSITQQIDSRCRRTILEAADKARESAQAASEEPAPKRQKTGKKAGNAASQQAKSSAEPLALLDETTEEQLKEAFALADEKVDLALQLYMQVDHRINQLDKEIKAFDAELADRRKTLGLQDGQPAAAALADLQKKAKRAAAKEGKTKKKGGGLSKAAASAVPLVIASAGEGEVDMAEAADEALYCTCRNISYGEMIGCDNPDCDIVWFHFGCVGIDPERRPSKTVKWYCDACTAKKKAGKLK